MGNAESSEANLEQANDSESAPRQERGPAVAERLLNEADQIHRKSEHLLDRLKYLEEYTRRRDGDDLTATMVFRGMPPPLH